MRKRPSKHEKLIPFDIATTLDSDEAIAEYLSQVIEDGDSEEFIRALGNIAKARGMTEIAEKSGLGRESLYKALRSDASPRFDTIRRVCLALGVKLRAVAA
jgi:probable addiction module antidote protein